MAFLHVTVSSGHVTVSSGIVNGCGGVTLLTLRVGPLAFLTPHLPHCGAQAKRKVDERSLQTVNHDEYVAAPREAGDVSDEAEQPGQAHDGQQAQVDEEVTLVGGSLSGGFSFRSHLFEFVHDEDEADKVDADHA